ncbi:probable RNA-binding protein CG14230 [Phlebotomus papatasi]|uniref:probable RNA-binding protein CG14230 n=1 Tax=Phlebotomus papatasi TaxID=29031 RepID=UPI002483B4ED|nr:probable RNA-binding protein CG14230 [Phlebotomus papatasi]
MTRLFVGNLPPKTTEGDLSKEFSAYGVVSSVDIKIKQNANNSSNKFAFVTMVIEESLVQQCIQEFREMPFHGHYLTVSVAKESFLEKLKREREEAANAEVESKRPKKAEDQEESEEFVVRKNAFKSEMQDKPAVDDEETFLVKKRGQGARMINGKLKILGDPEYVPNDDSLKEKPTERDSRSLQSEQKRLESLNRKKTAYNQQKFAIKAALSNTQNAEKGKKIVFGDTEETIKPMKLLDDDDDDEEVDFSIKQQFQGQSGQKLLNLQAKFQGDRRFALSEDFKEDGEAEDVTEKIPGEFDDEKKKQLEILEGVVGHSLASTKPKQTFQTMLRYDPTKKGHEKYLRKENDEEGERKKEVMRKEEPPVKVSSEKFYRINTSGIGESLKSGNEGFSLLKMLGRDSDPAESNHQETYVTTSLPSKASSGKRFKYDSSDEEDGKKKAAKVPATASSSKTSGKKNKRGLFRESFFINTGDSRLQEGAAFFQALEPIGEQFQEKRQQLKQIVWRKIKKNQLKDKQKFPRKKFINGKIKKIIK